MQIEVYKQGAIVSEEDPMDTYESNRTPEVGERIEAADFSNWEVTEIVNSTEIDGDVAICVTTDL